MSLIYKERERDERRRTKINNHDHERKILVTLVTFMDGFSKHLIRLSFPWDTRERKKRTNSSYDLDPWQKVNKWKNMIVTIHMHVAEESEIKIESHSRIKHFKLSRRQHTGQTEPTTSENQKRRCMQTNLQLAFSTATFVMYARPFNV